MAKTYLVDTSAIIKYLNGSLPVNHHDFLKVNTLKYTNPNKVD
jgi:hypothetical protein